MTDPCPWCGGENTIGTCPKAVTCPTCGAKPGSPCRRPSGHRAAQLHARRIALAEADEPSPAAPPPSPPGRGDIDEFLGPVVKPPSWSETFGAIRGRKIR